MRIGLEITGWKRIPSVPPVSEVFEIDKLRQYADPNEPIKNYLDLESKHITEKFENWSLSSPYK